MLGILSYSKLKHELGQIAVIFVVMSPLMSGARAQSAAPQKKDVESGKAGAAKSSAQNPAPAAGAAAAQDRSVLDQLNRDLEKLAAKVSPAVVQILVTGYGAAREEDRSQAAFIVRQHAVGSGVIVDSNGYIMTNSRRFAAPHGRFLRAGADR